MTEPQLHSSIIALVSLASGIAAKHPDMGLCQLDKLKQMSVPDSHINTVIEIARHIRDEAAEKLDSAFDEQSRDIKPATEESGTACCTPTASGQSCC
jgi:hypothetical protein